MVARDGGGVLFLGKVICMAGVYVIFCPRISQSTCSLSSLDCFRGQPIYGTQKAFPVLWTGVWVEAYMSISDSVSIWYQRHLFSTLGGGVKEPCNMV